MSPSKITSLLTQVRIPLQTILCTYGYKKPSAQLSFLYACQNALKDATLYKNNGVISPHYIWLVKMPLWTLLCIGF